MESWVSGKLVTIEWLQIERFIYAKKVLYK